MKILHICAGWQKWNGAANIARMIMGEQEREGHRVSFRTWANIKELRAADEVWIHCSWMPCLWWAALWGKNVHWVPECSYDPIRRAYHGWKKTLVGPNERFCLRRAKTIVATCEVEKGWIEAYLGKRCPPIEVTNIKRFFDLKRVERGMGRRSFASKGRFGEAEPEGSTSIRDTCRTCSKDESVIVNADKQRCGEAEDDSLHLLYLGRRHPLKGVEYLEAAVAELNEGSRSRESKLNSGIGNFSNVEGLSVHCSTSTLNFDSKQIELKIVSNAFGEEKERIWDWCDVLVLPTLSDNFGLVIAEALERGKRVITTDGAPVWDPGGGELGDSKDASTSTLNFDSNILVGYGGRLLYLKGYRDGSKEKRVELLKKVIVRVGEGFR